MSFVLRNALAAMKESRAPKGLAPIDEAELVIDVTPAGKLGESGFGVVRRAKWKGVDVAVKSLQRDTSETDEDSARRFEREMTAMAQMRHPNVVPVFGVCRHADGRISLVEELGPGGTVYGKIHQSRESAPLPLEDIVRIGLDVARALDYAHGVGVTHNDIKSANVSLKADGKAMLADFGLAKKVQTALPNTFRVLLTTSSGSGGGGLLGTVQWAAPENMSRKSPNKGQSPGDVYSFGMLLFEMCSGLLSWYSNSLPEVVMAVSVEQKRPNIPEYVDTRLSSIIKRCWAHEPAERCTTGQLLVELLALQAATFPSPTAAATNYFSDKIDTFIEGISDLNKTVPSISAKLTNLTKAIQQIGVEAAGGRAGAKQGGEGK